MSGTITVPNLFAAATSGTTVQLDADFAALTAAFNNPLTYAQYSTDSGAVNAYVATLAPAPATQAALLGVVIAFKATTANTAASTLNVNAQGVQAIVRPNGSAVQGGDIAGTVLIVWDGTNYVLQSAAVATLPNDYITGFTLTNNGATGFDVAAGQAKDGANTVSVVGAAIANKTQVAWVAGTGNGGKLSAAAIVVNTWYYWYALWKTADGTVDYGFDVATTPTFPTGYSKFRYIGGRKTQLASTNWDTFIQHGDEVYWSTPPALDFSLSAISTANRTLTTVNIPAVRVKWFGHLYTPSTNQNAAFILTDPATADVAPSGGGLTPLATLNFGTNIAASTENIALQATCWANASSQIGIRAINSVGLSMQTLGWTDPRGKPV